MVDGEEGDPKRRKEMLPHAPSGLHELQQWWCASKSPSLEFWESFPLQNYLCSAFSGHLTRLEVVQSLERPFKLARATKRGSLERATRSSEQGNSLERTGQLARANRATRSSESTQ
ncbi:hypothetical protein LR48_Vigan10g217700 [Vigna angularis]|uniref:Uncharacterized protein n=1 Tax=Phaseolus angularis TaxID=3914 RepID=A0A0L9VMJ8_PHAAN|nr:hypothetical protein LR48_Vigan10g217700 [Vigna angularis]